MRQSEIIFNTAIPNFEHLPEHPNIISVELSTYNIIPSLPSSSIFFRKNNITSTLLLYKANNQTIPNIVNNINSGWNRYTKEAKLSNGSQKITKNDCLKIILKDNLPQRFSFSSQNTLFSLYKNTKTLKSLKSLHYNFSITQCLADLESSISYDLKIDQFVQYSIFKEFQKRRLMKLEKIGPFVKFEEVNKTSSSNRIIKVEILVQNKILKISFSLPISVNNANHTKADQLSYIKEIKNNLDLINKKVKIGNFFLKNLLLCYSTSYYYSNITQNNMLTYLIIKKDLNLIYYFAPIINKIISDQPTQAETFLFDFSMLHSEKKMIAKEVTLTEEQYNKEIQIKMILDSSSDLFLANRFLHKKITFKGNHLVQYHINTQGESFQLFAQEYPGEAISSIFSLIDELIKFNLAFKTEHFPLNLFDWFEEKPIYNYELPLCELLCLTDSEKTLKKNEFGNEDSDSQEMEEEELPKIKQNLFLDILNFHSESLEKQKTFYDISEILALYSDLEFTPIDGETGSKRMALFESNSVSGVIKYKAICKTTDKVFLISQKNQYRRLDDIFSFGELNYEILLGLMKNLVKIIEEITIKNTCFSCFDNTCLYLNRNGKIRLEIKTPDEVKEEYKAIEVKHGRSYRYSLVYSFARVIEYWFCYFFCVQEGYNLLYVDFDEITCLTYSRISWMEELVKGCTQEKIVKRWNVSGIKEFLKHQLGIIN